MGWFLRHRDADCIFRDLQIRVLMRRFCLTTVLLNEYIAENDRIMEKLESRVSGTAPTESWLNCLSKACLKSVGKGFADASHPADLRTKRFQL